MREEADGGGPRIVPVVSADDIPDALDRVDLPRGRPVLVLVGGAAGMAQDDMRALDAVLLRAVLPVLEDRGATVVDGGTDSGVMRAIGHARAATGARFLLVGVVAEGTVVLPSEATRIDDAAELEANHTHVVVVRRPGQTWGSESPWIAMVADVIAAGKPSVTLLVNGGPIAYEDVECSLERGRPVVVLAGTGRAADAIAATRRGSAADSRAARIARSNMTRIIRADNFDGVRAAVTAALSTGASR